MQPHKLYYAIQLVFEMQGYGSHISDLNDQRMGSTITMKTLQSQAGYETNTKAKMKQSLKQNLAKNTPNTTYFLEHTNVSHVEIYEAHNYYVLTVLYSNKFMLGTSASCVLLTGIVLMGKVIITYVIEISKREM